MTNWSVIREWVVIGFLKKDDQLILLLKSGCSVVICLCWFTTKHMFIGKQKKKLFNFIVLDNDTYGF